MIAASPILSKKHQVAETNKVPTKQTFFSAVLQPKLTINQPGDIYEQEADSVAERIMRMPASANSPFFQAASPAITPVQKKCDACDEEQKLQRKEGGKDPLPIRTIDKGNVQMKCARCEEEVDGIQMKSNAPSANAQSVPSVVGDVVSSPGQSLDAATKNFMETRFGHDFAHVQVHNDSQAHQSSATINALAYTHGSHIVFGAGQYQPDTGAGKKLLAHELVHTIQQGQGTSNSLGKIQRKGDPKWHSRDKCDEYENPKDPCASWSDTKQLAQIVKLSTFSQSDWEVDALSTILKSSPGKNATARANLLRIACCSLQPDRAQMVLDVFIQRKGIAGAKFGELSTKTRCSLLHILKVRAGVAGASASAAFREGVELEIKESHDKHDAEKERAEAERIQFERDLVLHDQAGQTDWLSALLPAHTRHTRVFYAGQIKHPVLASSARLAERASTISLVTAVTEPITRPIATVIEFISCMISSIRSEDTAKLKDRFGVMFALSFPPGFQAGVLVGAGGEIAGIAKQIAEIISDPAGFVEDLANLLSLLWSPESMEIACAMGQDMGGEISKEIGSLADLGDLELSYEIGKIFGPTIMYTVLSLIAPEIVVGIKGTRIAKRLLKILEGMKDKLKWLKKWMKPDKHEIEVPTLPVAGSLKVFSGHVSMSDMLAWEKAGGHTIQHHGMMHTKVTLKSRVLGETEIPRPVAGESDLRLWGDKGGKVPAASKWKSDEVMREAIGNALKANPKDLEIASKLPVVEWLDIRFNAGKSIGEGWFTTKAPGSERGMFWVDDVTQLTVTLKPDGKGGWFVYSAFPGWN